MYPPHKSPAIINRYWSVISQALDSWPEPITVEPAQGVAFSTFVARLRDSVSALREHAYDGVELSFEQIEKLKEMGTRVVNDKVLLGQKSNLKDTIPLVQENKPSQADILSVTNPNDTVLKAVGTLIRYNVITMAKVSGVETTVVSEKLKSLTCIPAGESETIIYAG